MVSKDIRIDQNLAGRIIHPPENIANLNIPPKGSQVSLTVSLTAMRKFLLFLVGIKTGLVPRPIYIFIFCMLHDAKLRVEYKKDKAPIGTRSVVVRSGGDR